MYGRPTTLFFAFWWHLFWYMVYEYKIFSRFSYLFSHAIGIKLNLLCSAGLLFSINIWFAKPAHIFDCQTNAAAPTDVWLFGQGNKTQQHHLFFMLLNSISVSLRFLTLQTTLLHNVAWDTSSFRASVQQLHHIRICLGRIWCRGMSTPWKGHIYLVFFYNAFTSPSWIVSSWCSSHLHCSIIGSGRVGRLKRFGTLFMPWTYVGDPSWWLVSVWTVNWLWFIQSPTTRGKVWLPGS